MPSYTIPIYKPHLLIASYINILRILFSYHGPAPDKGISELKDPIEH